MGTKKEKTVDGVLGKMSKAPDVDLSECGIYTAGIDLERHVHWSHQIQFHARTEAEAVSMRDTAFEALLHAVPKDAKQARDQFDVIQALRTAIQQPAATEPADVTDEQIVSVMRDGNNCQHNDESDHIQFARAILELRPERMPMTDDDVDAKCLAIIGHLLSRRERDRIVWRMAEAHHDIKPKREDE